MTANVIVDVVNPKCFSTFYFTNYFVIVTNLAPIDTRCLCEPKVCMHAYVILIVLVHNIIDDLCNASNPIRMGIFVIHVNFFLCWWF